MQASASWRSGGSSQRQSKPCTRLLQTPAGLGQLYWPDGAGGLQPRPLAPGLPRGWRWLAGQPTCFPPRCNASPDGRGVLVTAMNQEGLGRKGSAQKSYVGVGVPASPRLAGRTEAASGRRT